VEDPEELVAPPVAVFALDAWPDGVVGIQKKDVANPSVP